MKVIMKLFEKYLEISNNFITRIIPLVNPDQKEHINIIILISSQIFLLISLISILYFSDTILIKLIILLLTTFIIIPAFKYLLGIISPSSASASSLSPDILSITKSSVLVLITSISITIISTAILITQGSKRVEKKVSYTVSVSQPDVPEQLPPPSPPKNYNLFDDIAYIKLSCPGYDNFLTCKSYKVSSALYETSKILTLGGKLKTEAIKSDTLLLEDYAGEVSVTDQVETYTPNLYQAWGKKSNFPSASYRYAAVTTSNNETYILNGKGELFQYLPANDSWLPLDSIPEPVIRPATCSHNNNIFIIGGVKKVESVEKQIAVDSVFIFDTNKKKWFSSPNTINHPRRFATCESINNELYLFGGDNPIKTSSSFGSIPIVRVEKLNLLNRDAKWEDVEAMLPYSKVAHTSFIFNDKIYLIGGYYSRKNEEDNSKIIIEFDPSKETFQPAGKLDKPIYFHTSQFIKRNNTLYIIGGLDETFESANI